jgi:hypothetical protein
MFRRVAVGSAASREHDHQRAVPDAGGGQHVVERAPTRRDRLVLGLVFLFFVVRYGYV